MLQKINVLLVEDVQSDRLMIAKAISNTGFNCEMKFAENIDDALTLSFLHHFDCIFLDYYFPTNGSGLDFIKTYQSRGGQSPVVIITSHTDIHLAVETMKSGASDYLCKQDITSEQVAKSIRYLIKLREANECRAIAERALRQSELQMKSIIERSPVIVFSIDNAGFFKMFKGQGATDINVIPQQIIGCNIQDIDHLIPVRYNDYCDAIAGKKMNHRAEIRNRFYDVNFIPSDNGSGKSSSMMGVAIDITDFKRQEVELLNTLEMTEDEARMKEQFLANMSHELRTPIHGIICLTDFVLKTDLTEDQQHYLELAKKSADSLLIIVNDILDLSKIRADKLHFEEIQFDLTETIEMSASAFKPAAIEKNLELKINISENVPASVTGDAYRLTQIINNLVGNAIKFTEKGSVSMNVHCKEKNEQYSLMQFEICDTGIGIPSHVLPSIFQSFSQAGNDITRKYGGTGLGLAITKQLVEQQNGNISVQSKVGEGSAFTFSIPYKTFSEAKQVNTTTTISGMNNTNTKKLNILVAEDNDINRFIIKKMIDDWGYNYEFAMTGAEVTVKASDHSYDIILMDVEMPEMNGYDATTFIRNNLPQGKNNIPIIAMTGHAMNGEKEKCIEAGMTDYISKPFQPDDLHNKILDCVENFSTTAMTNTPVSEIAQRCINLDFLTEISDGNEAFFNDFIHLFLKNAPLSITDMEQAFKNKEWETLRQAAHKIKPSLNYVGLKEISKAAARVEEFAKKMMQLDEIPALLNVIRTTCEMAYEELRQELAKSGTKQKVL